MKTISDAGTCKDGCTYLQGRLHVLAGADARTCGKRGSALQGRMQCTARADAVHCGSGCSALRLRQAKQTPKSPVLFWIREQGGEMHHTGHYIPHEISAEP